MNWTTIKAAVGNAIKTAKNSVVAWWDKNWKTFVPSVVTCILFFWLGYFAK